MNKSITLINRTGKEKIIYFKPDLITIMFGFVPMFLRGQYKEGVQDFLFFVGIVVAYLIPGLEVFVMTSMIAFLFTCLCLTRFLASKKAPSYIIKKLKKKGYVETFDGSRTQNTLDYDYLVQHEQLLKEEEGYVTSIDQEMYQDGLTTDFGRSHEYEDMMEIYNDNTFDNFE